MGLWDIEKIPYIGREKGPQEGLAFHYYDADKVVAGKKMKDWLRFGVAWWKARPSCGPFSRPTYGILSISHRPMGCSFAVGFYFGKAFFPADFRPS